MLTRRHIRAKVMQSLYAFGQTDNGNVHAEEKFLIKSMECMHDLFLLNLSLFVEIKDLAEDFLEKSSQKHLATEEERNPNRKFVNNRIIALIENNAFLNEQLEKRKLQHWKQNNEYVALIWDEIRQSLLYSTYMKTRESDFQEDKNFILDIFKEIIAPNEKLYDYLEDTKLTWPDDFPIVNTALLKTFQNIKASDKNLFVPRAFKNMDDRDFALELFKKTLNNTEAYTKEIKGKTPNWDSDRIAEIDLILLKMAICEFLGFPSIPVKVTINEYLEIAKEYSTPKSSIFINGVLDKLSKEYESGGKLNKTGRGLM
jgi:N utilization substance protein B